MNQENQIYGSIEKEETILEFNNEEDYLFNNCTFVNCKIIARVPYLELNNCQIIGSLSIHNHGIGDVDTVRIFETDLSEDNAANEISINSASVAIHSSNLIANSDIVLTSSELEILESIIQAVTIIDSHLEISIKDSQISDLRTKNPSMNTYVENSVINGVNLGISDSIDGIGNHYKL